MKRAAWSLALTLGLVVWAIIWDPFMLALFILAVLLAFGLSRL